MAAAALAVALGVAVSRAQDEGQSSAGTELSKDAQSVLNGGLNFLAAPDQQSTTNGAMKIPGTNSSLQLATTSLAGLAWLAAGSTPSRGHYKDNIRLALNYVLSQRDPKRAPLTYFGSPPENQQGRMHAHGFAMLFLAEAYGMLGGQRDKALALEVRAALEGAVKVSIASQTKEKGGWGYAFAGEAGANEYDEASTTITQIQGLRAARNAGIRVDSKTIDRAIKYVKKCVQEKGDCRYSLSMQEGERTSFELTAAAVSTLNAAGMYRSDKKLELALDYLRRQIAKKDKPTEACEQYYFYGNLYAAQAMFQAGGADWATWWKGAQEDLVARAQKRGADEYFWKDPREFGEGYATASACLILAIPMRYLPIFER